MTLDIAAWKQAGNLISDEDVDDNADIESSKIATRTLQIFLPARAGRATGTTGATNNGVFGGVIMPNSASSSIHWAMRIPAEYDSGDVTFKICLVRAGAGAGNIKFTLNIKSASVGDSLASGASGTATSAAPPTAAIKEMSVVMTAANFTAGEIVFVKLFRDPADAADTLAEDLIALGVSVEFTGRG